MSITSIIKTIKIFESNHTKKIGSVTRLVKKIVDGYSKKHEGQNMSQENSMIKEREDLSNSSKPEKKTEYKSQGIKVTDEMTDDADDRFINCIPQKVMKDSLSAIKNPMEAANLIYSVLEIGREVKNFREVQITKRLNIEAERQKAVEIIRAQKELLLVYLDKTFDERKNIFEKYFAVIDAAIEDGNVENLALGLNSISELAKSSPFKDLSNISEVGKALKNKNHTWDF